MNGPYRIPPAVGEVNEEFWTAGARGVLAINRCRNCSAWSHPPRRLCRYCGSQEIGPEAASGRGVVASFTVNHQQWGPDPTDPYVIALVELPEQPGLRLLTNIVNCTPDQVAIGSAVTVTFEHLDDVWLPLFELDAP